MTTTATFAQNTATTANFRFVSNERAGYRTVTVNDIPVNDLEHAARKIRATCIKNHCHYNGVAGYMSYGFVTLDGKTYRVDINRQGEISEIVEIA
jgi:hypothetical protein